ncbi:hypothetical protein RC1_3672 [Rhodospirillum centenum SW]|uniref:Uncharacterized protein n=1 Tax=Rhodospirillum centenum (strain ATCC 51521 / SW) TaxID=414684 RepID=B6IXJ7_RHOCS|nr:hypothetical protein RC1_3672 [Rhodospirillum centenum SW]
MIPISASPLTISRKYWPPSPDGQGRPQDGASHKDLRQRGREDQGMGSPARNGPRCRAG